jgi:N-methylhydantoinase A
MAAALENEIIGRGFDPRDFVLMSYGGAGPFHAAGYAASLGVDTIVVPGEAASVWSAFGISQADIRYQYESSVVLIEPFDPAAVKGAFEELDAQARAALGEREDVGSFEFRRYARMRFQWQRHELEMRFPDGELDAAALEEVKRQFVELYTERYGEVVEGPAVIDLAITGIVLPPGTRCERRQTGDFVITLEQASA